MAKKIDDPEMIAMECVRKAVAKFRAELDSALNGLSPSDLRRVRAWAVDRFPRLIEDGSENGNGAAQLTGATS